MCDSLDEASDSTRLQFAVGSNQVSKATPNLSKPITGDLGDTQTAVVSRFCYRFGLGGECYTAIAAGLYTPFPTAGREHGKKVSL